MANVNMFLAHLPRLKATNYVEGIRCHESLERAQSLKWEIKQLPVCMDKCLCLHKPVVTGWAGQTRQPEP